MIRMPQEHNVVHPPGQVINRPLRCKLNQTCDCTAGVCQDALPYPGHQDKSLDKMIEEYKREN